MSRVAESIQLYRAKLLSQEQVEKLVMADNSVFLLCGSIKLNNMYSPVERRQIAEEAKVFISIPDLFQYSERSTS
jgi:hypothetical protein